MELKIKCPQCKKPTKHAKKGFRITQNRGKIQKYLCLECQKYFTNDDGFHRMRNSDKVITMAIDIYLSNLSSRKMRNQLKRHTDTKISHVAILDWVRKYTMKVHNYVDKKKAVLGGQFYADETEINCGGRDDVFWCSVDWNTRFINGFHYSTTRDIKEGVIFIEKAIKHQLPKFIQTDAAVFYPRVMEKVFYTRRRHGWNGDRQRVNHIANNVRKTKKHNVRIETVFMKIKDRVNDFRGLKALWSAPILMTGLVIQHNFIEEHTTTRKVPCELAGIPKTESNNRWLELINKASMQA